MKKLSFVLMLTVLGAVSSGALFAANGGPTSPVKTKTAEQQFFEAAEAGNKVLLSQGLDQLQELAGCTRLSRSSYATKPNIWISNKAVNDALQIAMKNEKIGIVELLLTNRYSRELIFQQTLLDLKTHTNSNIKIAVKYELERRSFKPIRTAANVVLAVVLLYGLCWLNNNGPSIF